jgi:predicted peptidase
MSYLQSWNARFLCALGFMIFALAVVQGSDGPIGLESKEHYASKTETLAHSNSQGKCMPYRLYSPPRLEPGKTYPLVVSLHGAGSRGDDNVKHLVPWVAGWTADDVQKDNPCFIVMPQTKMQWVPVAFNNGSYSVDKRPPSESIVLLKEMVDVLLATKPIDRNRVYVVGTSMGGYGAWDFVLRNPDLPAAVVVFCGAGDPSAVDRLKDVPVWVFHGDQDKVVPVSGSTDMIQALKALGATDARLSLYEGVGHDVYTKSWKHPGLVEWMFQQQQSSKN